ncbi:MAG: hypothetical protein ACRDLR_04400 [Gaiellaceae bacterium]
MKLLLVSMLVVGGLGSITLQRVYAVFNTSTQNPGASLTSGTLVVGNTVTNNKTTTGSTCFSYGSGSSGNSNLGCDPLIVYTTGSDAIFPGVPVTAKVQLQNTGSLDASDLTVFMPSCTGGTTPDPSAPAGQIGAGNPCASAGAQFYLQETYANGSDKFCWYPDYASGSCTFDATYDLGYFATYVNTLGLSFHLGAGPTAGSSRYFRIGVEFPTTAPNSLQATTANFTLDWYLTS